MDSFQRAAYLKVSFFWFGGEFDVFFFFLGGQFLVCDFWEGEDIICGFKSGALGVFLTAPEFHWPSWDDVHASSLTKVMSLHL